MNTLWPKRPARTLLPPFHLDLANEQLWRGAELLPLRPKAFRLLRYLAEHPQRLVTQEELLKAVWQHSYVNDGLLRGYIRELRGLLGDDAKAPRFIETASGRGYRFIASITPTPAPSPIESSVPPTLQPPPGFVGRQEELAQLHRALERALLGERQVVLVAGEPGIGKTTLIDALSGAGCGGSGPVGRARAVYRSLWRRRGLPSAARGLRGGLRAGGRGERSSRCYAGRPPPGSSRCLP
jgi:DNA-binding winged helix-turn-helix (wHTH) protein